MLWAKDSLENNLFWNKFFLVSTAYMYGLNDGEYHPCVESIFPPQPISLFSGKLIKPQTRNSIYLKERNLVFKGLGHDSINIHSLLSLHRLLLIISTSKINPHLPYLLLIHSAGVNFNLSRYLLCPHVRGDCIQRNGLVTFQIYCLARSTRVKVKEYIRIDRIYPTLGEWWGDRSLTVIRWLKRILYKSVTDSIVWRLHFRCPSSVRWWPKRSLRVDLTNKALRGISSLGVMVNVWLWLRRVPPSYSHVREMLTAGNFFRGKSCMKRFCAVYMRLEGISNVRDKASISDNCAHADNNSVLECVWCPWSSFSSHEFIATRWQHSWQGLWTQRRKTF